MKKLAKVIIKAMGNEELIQKLFVDLVKEDTGEDVDIEKIKPLVERFKDEIPEEWTENQKKAYLIAMAFHGYDVVSVWEDDGQSKDAYLKEILQEKNVNLSDKEFDEVSEYIWMTFM